MPLHPQKNKENQKKRNIKSRKIDNKKRKNISVQVHHNSTPLLMFLLQKNLPLPPLSPFLSILPNSFLISSNIHP